MFRLFSSLLLFMQSALGFLVGEKHQPKVKNAIMMVLNKMGCIVFLA